MPARSDSSATWHTRASSPSDRLSPSIQTSIAPKTAAAMQRAVTAMRSRSSGRRVRRAATALQLGRDGVGEVGLDILDMADDAARVELAVAQRGDFRHGVNVIRETRRSPTAPNR